MKRLGIAISVNKKLEQLAAAVAIMASWPDRPFIAVCCNDHDAFKHVESMVASRMIDAAELGDCDILTSPKQYLRLRQFDCIRRSITACFACADIVMHVHADACALDSKAVFSIIDEMRTRECLAAFRGRGLGPAARFNAKTPYGDVDDHFLFVDCAAAEASHLFDCEPLGVLSTCNVESLLAYRLQGTFGADKLWHYDDMASNIVDECARSGRDMNPFNYDPVRKFLHAAELSRAIAFMDEAGLGDIARPAVDDMRRCIQPIDHIDEWMHS